MLREAVQLHDIFIRMFSRSKIISFNLRLFWEMKMFW